MFKGIMQSIGTVSLAVVMGPHLQAADHGPVFGLATPTNLTFAAQQGFDPRWAGKPNSCNADIGKTAE